MNRKPLTSWETAALVFARAQVALAKAEHKAYTAGEEFDAARARLHRASLEEFAPASPTPTLNGVLLQNAEESFAREFESANVIEVNSDDVNVDVE